MLSAAPPGPPSQEGGADEGALAAARRREERLRALVDFTAQIFWTSSQQWQVDDSSSWRAFTGQSEEDVREGRWQEAIHPEDLPEYLRQWARAFAEPRSFEARHRLRRRDGRYLWMLMRAVPLLDAAGRVREWVGSATDIHAQHLVEQRAAFLARAGELFANSSLDAVTTLSTLARLAVPTLADWCIVDLLHSDGHFERAQVLAADPADAALAEEVRGLPPVPSERPVYPPAVALATGRPSLVGEVTEARMQQVAQNPRHLVAMRRVGIRSLLTVALIARGRILGAMTLLHTRSGRRYEEDDLRFAQELAHRAALTLDNARLYQESQEAIRPRDEFLSIASHELKTPLTPLNLKLQSLERAARAQGDSPLAGMVRTHVESGRRQLRRLATLINDLLDVSRISAGTFRMHREAVDLADLVRDVALHFEPRATQAGSALTVRADGPVRGHWDRARLEQVVANLLDNALKYGAGMPVSLEVAVGEGVARLIVRDEGIGIPPALQPRIFDRYVRAVSERHYGGLGLGLYITRTIVEEQGGRVSVESVPERGSTFTVELPLPP